MVGPPSQSDRSDRDTHGYLFTSRANPLQSSPPEAWAPLLRFARFAGRPLERFLHIEAASGILLLVATAVALASANSPWAAFIRPRCASVRIALARSCAS